LGGAVFVSAGGGVAGAGVAAGTAGAIVWGVGWSMRDGASGWSDVSGAGARNGKDEVEAGAGAVLVD